MNRNAVLAITAAMACGILLAGCGQSNLPNGQLPDSFAAAASKTTTNSVVTAEKAPTIGDTASREETDVKDIPESTDGNPEEQTSSAYDKKTIDASLSTSGNKFTAMSSTQAPNGATAQTTQGAVDKVPPVRQSTTDSRKNPAPDNDTHLERKAALHKSTDPMRTTPPKLSKSEGTSPSAQKSTQVKASQLAVNDKKLNKPAAVQGRSPDSKNEAAKSQSKPVVQQPAPKSYSNTLLWSEFFDNEKQNTPSEKFWELSGKQVTIKGYMGEVLSFDKNWFLLIPAPGAECPFDNGDETYWNKIMMVFVPNDTKLRYTSGPLELTGTLDVGIKIDESGYKTMFRLYDTTFEKISE
ncbi:hypothetical protein [Paenibacillus sp. UMB4589-SE434]|uniref:hypothetical protein n=1 Tax=Paenibacillus sp. UMB4589-SE434 TaxID=3046314 RepID=UPI002550E273|nr:hypothetical protein [Paenibacillus sp. UMB4589-SE434]MDK8183023.1 hypothetical protein [Paenibacillus sp. UMB4589-SE434]